jgi:hypothetical protein
MMKKIYTTPEVNVIEIITAHMLATSILINSEDEAVDAGGALSREFDYEDEEE